MKSYVNFKETKETAKNVVPIVCSESDVGIYISLDWPTCCEGNIERSSNPSSLHCVIDGEKGYNGA